MQVENHKEEAPFAHYAELFRNLNPAAVTARLSDVRWDGKEFTLSLLGRAFAIAHPDYAIRALDGGALPPLPSQTFLLRYLLESKDVVWQGQWKTFREMPWGEMYIKPYTGRVPVCLNLGKRTPEVPVFRLHLHGSRKKIHFRFFHARHGIRHLLHPCGTGRAGHAGDIEFEFHDSPSISVEFIK